MKITILQNSDESFYKAIEEALGWADSLYLGVAYASYNAFGFLRDPSRRSRENLIRIDVRNVPYELLGTHWRRIFLKDFVQYMKAKKQKNNPNQLK
jgi:hypothetical protein